MAQVSISNEEFEKRINEVILIDVRTPQEYQVLDKISGSLNIPFEEFRTQECMKKLKDKYGADKLIVTVCNAGNRSGMAADYLRENGFSNSFVLINGVYGYNRFKNKK